MLMSFTPGPKTATPTVRMFGGFESASGFVRAVSELVNSKLMYHV